MDSGSEAHEAKSFHHHQVGELTLTYDSFTVDGATDQQQRADLRPAEAVLDTGSLDWLRAALGEQKC
ncbi:hypothetical protein AB0D14_26760 [Streptomyces sp. NPDC048484]|uniref:hypothetical protein n=1 Tax=Streptomyces sp. NPDC048484 TaxID=3155146 RepID=UPI003437677F